MEVVFDQGIYFPEIDLWLDPHRSKASAFVSHAHSDHTKNHRRIYATPATAALMRARGIGRAQYMETPYGAPVTWGQAKVTLYPAGHVLGSAQVLVEVSGVRVLYSGDFKLRTGWSCEPVEVPEADIVIMETTFGRPRYRFPDAELVMREIISWCQDVLDDDAIPVLLCYSLGKGQEVLAGLKDAPFPVHLQTAHWKITEVYRQMGIEFMTYSRHEIGKDPEGVFICSGQCRRFRWFQNMCGRRPVRTAYISGWALDPWRKFGTEIGFALSDHADYPDLVEYVNRTGASTVYTVHGFEQDFAADLRAKGLKARPLKETAPSVPSPQLTLF